MYKSEITNPFEKFIKPNISQEFKLPKLFMNFSFKLTLNFKLAFLLISRPLLLIFFARRVARSKDIRNIDWGSAVWTRPAVSWAPRCPDAWESLWQSGRQCPGHSHSHSMEFIRHRQLPRHPACPSSSPTTNTFRN